MEGWQNEPFLDLHGSISKTVRDIGYWAYWGHEFELSGSCGDSDST